MNDFERQVHHLYHDLDFNCARTMLACLSARFGIPLERQVFDAALGMHGAGRFRAQCGLVEGALMFIGIAGSAGSRSVGDIETVCRQFAEQFTARFGSLRCLELRPGGFLPSDPPHACEKLTAEAVEFAAQFIGLALRCSETALSGAEKGI